MVALITAAKRSRFWLLLLVCLVMLPPLLGGPSEDDEPTLQDALMKDLEEEWTKPSQRRNPRRGCLCCGGDSARRKYPTDGRQPSCLQGLKNKAARLFCCSCVACE